MRPLTDADVLLSVGFADYAAAHPDDEIVVYYNAAQFDPALTALIRLPRQRLAQERRLGRVPFFRHGNVMRIEPPALVDPKKMFCVLSSREIQ